jgi:hypothetical protein
MSTPPGCRIKSATISPCGKYRYTLERRESERGPFVLWLMLNPSTADADKDDPTIRKCAGFTHRMGFRNFEVCNLAAYRATDPRHLFAARKSGVDIVGPDNIRTLSWKIQRAAVIVGAWGTHGYQLGSERGNIDGLVWSAGKRTYNLGYTANDQPRHPLMVGYEDGLMRMAVPPRQFGCAPLEPSETLLQAMLSGFETIQGKEWIISE